MNFKRFHESKNLLDLTALINAPSGTFTTQDGTITFTADHLLEIQLKPNTYYKMSSNYVKTGTKSNIIYLQYADSSKATTSTVSPSYKTNNTGVVKIAMYTSRDGADDFISGLAWVMLNEGDTALPYEPYSSEVWHDTPHYIHNTSTDTITTLPAVLYPNAVTATVGLKGNMSQTGTPSPTTPIQPSECGEMTGNLFDIESWLKANDTTYTKSGDTYTFEAKQSMYNTPYYFSDTDIAVSISGILENITSVYARIDLMHADGTISSGNVITASTSKSENIYCAGLRFNWSTRGTVSLSNIMLNTGSTAKPYEPYGYKFPILNNSQTTNVYLGEVQSTRRIKKLVLTGDETDWQYYSGTNAYRYALSTIFNTGMPTATILSTHFEYAPYEAVGGQAGTITNSSASNFRCWIWSDIDNLTDFQAWLKTQYNNGAPVTIWYVLATPETAVVNEPLRKISDYADTVSGITIPTTAGTNTLSIGTTLQPSEVTATYKGWHPVANVHEAENGQWD